MSFFSHLFRNYHMLILQLRMWQDNTFSVNERIMTRQTYILRKQWSRYYMCKRESTGLAGWESYGWERGVFTWNPQQKALLQMWKMTVRYQRFLFNSVLSSGFFFFFCLRKEMLGWIFGAAVKMALESPPYYIIAFAWVLAQFPLLLSCNKLTGSSKWHLE